jgi:UDP-GlcNAc:undecaprenyl-phosphate/decaprenyl-phosphate GlcNAc-1-phosphate transferase
VSGVSAAAAAVALPVAAFVIWLLLHSPLARRLVAHPTGERWSEHVTPTFGGVGIFLGLAAGIAAAIAAGGVHAHGELLGVLGGAALLFAVGLVDDVYTLPAPIKLAAQFGAAAIALSSGLSVEIVSNDVLVWVIGLLWLVGMTNAFNLLDNMDGLAGTLALIAAVFFAIDAVTVHEERLLLVLSLSLGLASLGFLLFNFRPGKPALVFMGDSGSQVLGFTLGALGLATSWKVAETTVATLMLPILVLAVPILDTALVTAVRMRERRPIHQGGKDHTSHRLVRGGLSEQKTVVLLAAIAAGLGATSLAYSVLGDYRITLVGVLVTFALLVQFAGFLVDLERGSTSETEAVPGGWMLRTVVLHRRRLLEVLLDFVLISACFAFAYLLIVQGMGTQYQRHVFTVALPAVLITRYIAFILLGLYQGIWRFAGSREAASIVLGVLVSELAAVGIVVATTPLGDFPFSVFVLDALLCIPVVGASRFGERALFRARSTLRERDARRTLIVGAGRSGRSLLRELRETPGERVVGFVDDDPRLHRRRLLGVPVRGGTLDIDRILDAARPDTVLVTIPRAPADRLDAVVRACAAVDVPCRFVRRETDLDPVAVLGAAQGHS